MTVLASNSWIAVGGDAYALAALCEHLPANPAIVTTRDALAAQLEAYRSANKNAVLMLDDSADTVSLHPLLQEHAPRLHLLYLKTASARVDPPSARSIQLIDKPLEIPTLRRILARAVSQANLVPEVVISPLCTLKMDRRIITNPASGMQAEMTEKETQILELLSLVRPKPATREQLHKEVWGYQGELNTHTLETHIYRLRSKLKDIGAADVKIESTPQGYILDAA